MKEKEQPGTGVTPQFAALRRPAWIPETEPGDGAPADSKFAGTPYLGDGGEWPPCPKCRRPLQLFLQLNLGQLPEAARGEFGEGLLQFFHCTYSDTSCDQFFDTSPHFSNGVLLRLLPAEGTAGTYTGHARPPEFAAPNRGEEAPPSVPDEPPSPKLGGGWREAAKGVLLDLLRLGRGTSKQDGGAHPPLPPRRIIGWREVCEYPGYMETCDLLLGRELTDDEEDEIYEAEPRVGDKLGGWPYWVHEPEYPDCPVCGRRMRHVFQLASEENLNYVFGDHGIGYVTQCTEHKDVMGFHWAST
ncbi:MAG TPA: DUF1963 domain-containing protein [Pyrinomonadaceae bacterium]|nr:DUF1963 domain-containing protein [Pyrinomonadaceae bacterium]